MKVILTMDTSLAGSASAPPSTQTVEVPFYVPGVKDVPVRPAFEFDELSSGASDGLKVLALARDRGLGRKCE
jgi:hypothetical protein